MAQVIYIRYATFTDEHDDVVTYGTCSNCSGQLISQWMNGFPTKCPYCKENLENGTDDRSWITGNDQTIQPDQ